MKQNDIAIINILKAIASQLIVLHHALNYGNLSTNLLNISGDIGEQFYNYSRMVVQIFIVIGGYLAAKILTEDNNRSISKTTKQIVNRYIRLSIPFIVALILTILTTIVSNKLGGNNFNSESFSIEQFIAHAFLLHGVLNFDSISAGAWYVAIDFQLYILLALLIYLSNSKEIFLKCLLLILGGMSLMVWNLNSELDTWAIYFMGAYTIGILSWNKESNHITTYIIILIGLASIYYEFRERILLAVITGIILASSIQDNKIIHNFGNSKAIKLLSKISYSLFLSHFSLIILFNTFIKVGQPELESIISLILLITSSNLLGYIFYKKIELPVSRFKLTTVKV